MKIKDIIKKNFPSNEIQNKKIFFLHFPKCGGNSIDRAIRNSFSYFEKQNLFHLQPHASLKASKVANSELMNYREKILLYYMADSNCKYISGHFKYSQKAYQEFGDEWHFITILRHPISKWISHYFYNKFKDDSHFRIDDNIEDFLKSKRGIDLGRDYVSKLTTLSEESDYSSDNIVEEAIINLNRFSLVGVLEDTDGFCQNYYDLFDKKIVVKKINQNPISKAKQREKITDEARNKIEEICQPNMRVYESVLKQTKSKSIV